MKQLILSHDAGWHLYGTQIMIDYTYAQESQVKDILVNGSNI